ncbi:MAG TPA: CehA/McbA family metallohydrolase [Polyangiaceae bacterium]|nr:CehA/McbA family metallohydrolase [Polyangiaceae bacterium]
MASPTLTVSAADGARSDDIELAVVVDESVQPIVVASMAMQLEPEGVRARIPIALEGSRFDVDLEMHVDIAHDALVAQLALPEIRQIGGHRLALRAELAADAATLFVSGTGTVAERAKVTGAALVLDTDPHPLAIASTSGPMAVETISEESLAPGEPMRVAATSPPATATDHPIAELHVVVGESSQAIWPLLSQLGGVPSVPVRGRVAGIVGRATVVGRDVQGSPVVRARTAEGGLFAFEVPASVVQWYAEFAPGLASALTAATTASDGELRLEVPPGGEVRVRVVDADAREPLTARLLFHGLHDTVDPNFGPDYRASGAGPIVDSLRGDATVSLPSGRYRVAATKGIEWSLDAQEVDVTPGRRIDVTLALRHVVPTPGTLGCDLHVHARPSFDSPVTPEDRVLSLVAAGIDFAVPTEHNVVGDYASAIETLEVGRDFISVPGVEVTTLSLGFGHFGVFPYDPGARVPPFKHTRVEPIFRAVRSDPSRYFQVNHPRLGGGIGYFDTIGFDPRGGRSQVQKRIDFDGIEVYNGFDITQPDRVEQVLHDYWALLDFGWRFTATGSSDSHRIQYQWAGYPRTMVTVDPAASAADDALPADPMVVVENLKKSHATVTSGPIIELAAADARPGDELVTTTDPVPVHVRVRAAPWVDVTRVDVVIGQIDGRWSVAQSFDVPSRPLAIGPEDGTLAEAQQRTVRFDRDLTIAVGSGNGWIAVVARGARPMGDVLPFVNVAPLAFTNPIYVVRRPSPPPPFPAGGLRPAP